MANYSVVPHQGFQPPNAALMGKEVNNPQCFALAIAHTPYGRIPGKAQGNMCWYPYGGKEMTTPSFSWVLTMSTHLRLVMNAGWAPPNAMGEGFQSDQPPGEQTLFCAVAITQWGTIPGKAKGNTCWYPYGGREHTTDSFYWVVQY